MIDDLTIAYRVLLISPLPICIGACAEAHSEFGMATVSRENDLFGEYMAIILIIMLIAIQQRCKIGIAFLEWQCRPLRAGDVMPDLRFPALCGEC